MAWYKVGFCRLVWLLEQRLGGGGEQVSGERPAPRPGVSHAFGKEVGGLAWLWALFCLPQGRL